MRHTTNRSQILNQALFETLETRRLCSVTPVVLTDAGMLVVTGTAKGDTISFSVNSQDPTQLDVFYNGTTQTFAVDSIVGISANGAGGSDILTANQTNGTISIPMTLLGGGGNDTLIGGSGDDSLDGGDGMDSILGSAGDDTIIGGNGKDQLDGGSDSDILKGGNGVDSLNGGNGDDDLDGNNGNDLLTGGNDSDAFARGTGGKDSISDEIPGVDRAYKPFSMAQLPKHYQDLFNTTFPNSTPLGVRMNDDQTFTMVYKYFGDNKVYHAYFVYTGEDPLHNLDNVNLQAYEVAPDSLPPNTAAAFEELYPDAQIKEIFAYHVGDSKVAHIRIKMGDSDSIWVDMDWMDNT